MGSGRLREDLAFVAQQTGDARDAAQVAHQARQMHAIFDLYREVQVLSLIHI